MDKKIVLGLGILSVLLGIMATIGCTEYITSRQSWSMRTIVSWGYYLSFAAIIFGGLSFILKEKQARRIGILGMIFGIMGMIQITILTMTIAIIESILK